jgi:hypothetical protein
MNRFAIDIVILPPEAIMDNIVAWNQSLCKQRPDNIVQNKFDSLPHVSLAMGCLQANRLPQAKETLQTLAKNHRTLLVEIPQLKLVGTGSGDDIVTLDISNTSALRNLHEDITTSFRPMLTNDATEEDLFDAPPIEPSSIDWINHYIRDQSFDAFWPHITVGFGSAPGDFEPFSFRGDRLAICHLGNHCTCRQILSEVSLK